jgi:hypothetical protein
MYHNNTPRGGRPNVDTVIMVKLLVLQQWYGHSDDGCYKVCGIAAEVAAARLLPIIENKV